MKKTLIIILLILIIAIVYWYTQLSPKAVKENCLNNARAEFKQGVISGPDAIGNRMERCLAEHGITSEI